MSASRERIRGDGIRFAILVLAVVLTGGPAASQIGEPVGGPKHLAATNGKSWYRGNTHTHTLWSDGDAAPEWATAWYKEHGYDFLSLTDHNVMLKGERTFPVDAKSRLTTQRLNQLREKFGEDSVDLRTGSTGRVSMRLRTLDELRAQFDEPGKFILIEGEEITGHTHVNGINTRELIKASRSKENVTSLREQVVAVHAQSARLKEPMFAHIDHANWGSAISAEEIVAVREARFFEIYNGHGGVRNWGSTSLRIPDMDRKWDIILTFRLSTNSDDMFYGVATDDTHTYFVHGAGHQIPGRGWSMVLADKLDVDSLVHAFLEGNFYASAGVLLDEVKWDRREFIVTPRTEAGTTYTTQFIGTRLGYDASSRPAVDDDGTVLDHRTRVYSSEIGEVLYETTDVPAVYRFKGDEIYVRAKVISSKLKSEPFRDGDLEMAWTQPVALTQKR